MKTSFSRIVIIVFLLLSMVSVNQSMNINHTIIANHYLSSSEKKPEHFKIRGMKGWGWTPEQYLEEIPHLVQFKMNFMMNCYISLWDLENYKWEESNRWWEALPEKKKHGFEKVVKACQDAKIEFCFSMNPSLCSKRFADISSQQDIEDLWKHYSWMQSLGVRWFNISLDDTENGINPIMNAQIVNELFRRLRNKDPQAQMIFCPRWYWGRGEGPYHDYLKKVGELLHPEVYIFWTGDEAITPYITRESAEGYRSIINHRLIIWDNYPVNDGSPTMHLGPLTGRARDLHEVADGYMSNAMHKQNRLNRLPLMTCADYAFNPRSYNSERSLAKAISYISKDKHQARVLEEVINAYPGMLVFKKDHRYTPVREKFSLLLASNSPRSEIEQYIRNFEILSNKFQSLFSDYYQAEKDTLGEDLLWLKQAMSNYVKK